MHTKSKSTLKFKLKLKIPIIKFNILKFFHFPTAIAYVKACYTNS